MTTGEPAHDGSARPVRILVVNCNVTASVTEVIAEAATRAAGPGTEVTAISPEWGVASAEGYLDSYVSAVAVLERIALWPHPMDAVVLAGFGEHGREAARELLDVPVVDITDAAAHVALLLAPRYGVVTTLPRSLVQIADSLRTAGVHEHCVGVRATGLAVLDLEQDATLTRAAVVRQGRALLELGAEALVLGCAGLSGLSAGVEAELGVPVVDPVASGVALAEALVRLGLRTSKVCSYAPPLPKARPGWPSMRATRASVAGASAEASAGASTGASAIVEDAEFACNSGDSVRMMP
jgi:allantoin racemase